MYKWSPQVIDALYWDDAVEWAEQADYHLRTDYKMRLAISTNPHLKADAQRTLWRSLDARRKKPAPVRGLSKYKEEAAKLNAALEAKRREKGKNW